MTPIFIITAFLGAGLLFVVQPMVGKLVLPVFGGTSMTWAGVMLFFTVILLLGYGYVVWLTKRSKRQQFILHRLLIFATSVWLIVNFSGPRTFFLTQQDPFVNNLPVLSLIAMMLKVLALPCFLLATTSALLQSWYARSFPKKSPYWLYIVSNTGSLLGLLAYPFIIEPNLTLRVQQTLWVLGFIIYAALVLFVTFLIRRKSGSILTNLKSDKINQWKNWAWFTLPFVSTTAMLAFTNQITQVISPVPFIWVATLAVYLLSYIVAFVEGRWYPEKFMGVLLLCSIVALSIVNSGYVKLGLPDTLALILITLFIIDLVCHRELFKRRPKPAGLSVYYVMVALGGVVASIFIAVIAPAIFPDIWEYPALLMISVIVGVYILFRESRLSFRLFSGILGILIIVLIGWMFAYSRKSLVKTQAIPVVNLRDFYGVLHVVKSGNTIPYFIDLFSGSTSHGYQLIGGSDENIPTSDYNRDGGLGYAILNYSKRVHNYPTRIGVIGLGAGTTAAYCGSGDTIRFYEINPQVTEVARKYFTYLSNAQKAGCNVEVVEGDGRISLEKEQQKGKNGKFDVLAIDAFTDNSIPTHLLTREAVELYLSHLKEGGIIAFLITAKYFNLGPTLESVAAGEKLYYYDFKTTNPYTRWILMSKNSTGSQSYVPSLENTKMPPWTDDYSNILQALY